MKKDLEREKVLDQIHDLEQVLVGLGHMRAKRVMRKKKKVTKKKGPKARKVQDIEIQDEEDDDEEPK